MNCNHMSVSRHGVWELCRAQYKFKYHLGLKSSEPEPIYFLYGGIVHRCAEEYVKAKGEWPINEIAGDILSGKIKIEKKGSGPGEKFYESISLPEDYKKKLPLHLASIAKISKQLGFDGPTEHPFEYDLDPPNKKLVVGFIDRLIIKEDKFWILDYKTTKKGWWRKNRSTIVNDLQLRMYARVVQREFGAKPENIKAALYYLEGEELVGATFTESSLIAAEQDMLQAFKEIESMQPEDAWGKVGDHCRRCDYRKICPFYSLT